MHNSCDPKFGYNISPTAGSPRGVKHTAETKKKLSDTHKGKPKSPEHIANMKLAKQNMEESTKRKMSEYARNRSDEHKRKLAESMKGKSNGLGSKRTPEFCKRASEIVRLRWARWRKSGDIVDIGKRISEGHSRRTK